MTRISNIPISFALLDSRYVNVTGDSMTGALTITPSVDSTSVFKVTNAANTYTYLQIDSTNSRVFFWGTTGTHSHNFNSDIGMYGDYQEIHFSKMGGSFGSDRTSNGWLLNLGGGDSTRAVVFGTSYNNYDHGNQTHPTFFFHDVSNPDVSNNKWGSFGHDGTGLVLTTGANIGVGTTPATIDNYIAFNPRETERVRIDGNGNVGIGTTGPTNILSLGGNSARIFWLERHTTANTAGNTLTITAGGATSGATDKAGGALILQGGLSTGSAESGVTIQGCVAGATGTADRTQTTAIQVLGNKIGFYAVTPVVRPTALTTQLTAITHTAPGTPDYAIQNFTQTNPFGFVTADEANTVLSVIANLQTRISELETKLQALGLLT